MKNNDPYLMNEQDFAVWLKIEKTKKKRLHTVTNIFVLLLFIGFPIWGVLTQARLTFILFPELVLFVFILVGFIGSLIINKIIKHS